MSPFYLPALSGSIRPASALEKAAPQEQTTALRHAPCILSGRGAMQRGIRLFLLALIGLALSGCGSVRSFPPPVPTADDWWEVRLTQTGGFVGVHLVVEASSGGELSVEDVRSGRSARRQLPQAALESLDQLIAQALGANRDGNLSPCADCFVYELEITSAEGVMRLQADDATLESSGALQLIELLKQVRDQALQTSY